MPRQYHLDKVGQRFGRLTFHGMSEEIHPTAGRYLGHFTCDCGKKVLTLPTLIFRGKSKSCGCYRRDMGSDPEKVRVRMMGQHQADVKHPHNRSGYRHICKRTESDLYQMKLSFNGTTYRETFSTLTEAIKARNNLCQSLGLDIPVP